MASRLLVVKRLSRWAKAAATASSSSSSLLSSASIYSSNGLYIGARSLHPAAPFANARWSELNHHSSCNGRRNITLLALNDLSDNKGSRKKKTRKGRGIGSGKGKTAGKGHKGQRARKGVKLGFEGGQTPLRRKVPKRGFKNPFTLHFQPISLKKLAKYINAGRIDSSELITMKTLRDCGALRKKVEDGVRLFSCGAEEIRWPIHIEVSRVTQRAKEAVESAGGSVRRVHYNRLGLRALLKPEWFEKKGRLLPRPARPPPKLRLKVDSIGRLPAPTAPIPFTSENVTEVSA